MSGRGIFSGPGPVIAWRICGNARNIQTKLPLSELESGF
jgi:hypothetical protein